MFHSRHILLIVLAALIAWRILATGLSAHYANLAGQGDADAIETLLAWNQDWPNGLVRKALSTIDDDPESASALLERAYAENPTAARPLLVLAIIAERSGDRKRAYELIDRASRLMPANPRIQIEIGNFLANTGDLGTAMVHWTQALDSSRSAARDLYPVLLRLAEEPQTRGIFKTLAASPPGWWGGFFAQTAHRALDLETVRILYAFRRAARDTPITTNERKAYIGRLQKEGKITEAYLVWVNGLDDARRSQLGILNNGSFELQPDGSGFDWHLRMADQVSISTRGTAGTVGNKALHIELRRMETRFEHVLQPLFLDPSEYLVQGMVRTEGLDSPRGLKWVVNCTFPRGRRLGESERFLGSSEWREFSFLVKVPEDCTGQVILLISAGRADFEHKATGTIWFDGMLMKKIETSEKDAAALSPVKDRADVADDTSAPFESGAQIDRKGGSYLFQPKLLDALQSQGN